MTQSSIGQIAAGDSGSVGYVYLYNGSSIAGGSLRSPNGGAIYAYDGTSTVSDVTNQGDLAILNGKILQAGGLSLTDNWDIRDYGTFRPIANVTLGGPLSPAARLGVRRSRR